MHRGMHAHRVLHRRWEAHLRQHRRGRRHGWPSHGPAHGHQVGHARGRRQEGPLGACNREVLVCHVHSLAQLRPHLVVVAHRRLLARHVHLLVQLRLHLVQLRIHLRVGKEACRRRRVVWCGLCSVEPARARELWAFLLRGGGREGRSLEWRAGAYFYILRATVAVDPLGLQSIYCTYECVGLSRVCARRESAWQYRGAQGLSRRSGSAWTPPFAQSCPGYASEPC